MTNYRGRAPRHRRRGRGRDPSAPGAAPSYGVHLLARRAPAFNGVSVFQEPPPAVPYTQPGSNWRPSACGGDVITTRPWVQILHRSSARNVLGAATPQSHNTAGEAWRGVRLAGQEGREAGKLSATNVGDVAFGHRPIWQGARRAFVWRAVQHCRFRFGRLNTGRFWASLDFARLDRLNLNTRARPRSMKASGPEPRLGGPRPLAFLWHWSPNSPSSPDATPRASGGWARPSEGRDCRAPMFGMAAVPHPKAMRALYRQRQECLPP